MHQDQVQIKEFTQLIQEHERLIYKICAIYASNTEDCKDLFQEIVIQIWSAYPRFKAIAKISTWLYKIALNTAISYKRKKRKTSLIVLPGLLHDPPDDAAPQAYSEEYKIFQQIIGSLPTLEKALVLLYLEDRSYQEIAEIMGISPSNVGTRLGRIREKLKNKAKQYSSPQ